MSRISFQASKKLLRSHFFKQRDNIPLAEKLLKEQTMEENYATLISELFDNKTQNFENPEKIVIGGFMPIKSEVNIYQIVTNLEKKFPEL
jgi:5-keto 4-deoxyuronate isomerase